EQPGIGDLDALQADRPELGRAYPDGRDGFGPVTRCAGLDQYRAQAERSPAGPGEYHAEIGPERVSDVALRPVQAAAAALGPVQPRLDVRRVRAALGLGQREEGPGGPLQYTPEEPGLLVFAPQGVHDDATHRR